MSTEPDNLMDKGSGDSLQRAGSDASSSDQRLAARLISVLSCEVLYKADLFDYLCWLQDKHTSEVPELRGKDNLCMASDGTTCWGKTYADAVKVAMKHDKGIQDGKHQNAELCSGSEPSASAIG